MKITLNQKEIELTDAEVQEIVDKYEKKGEFKTGQDYWFVSAMCDLSRDTYNNSPYDQFRIETGNAFHTKEEAETELERRKIKARLWKWAKDNAPFEPDWSNGQERKYFIMYYHNDNRPSWDYWYNQQYQTELPHFKSEEDVKRFIEENTADLLKWFTGK